MVQGRVYAAGGGESHEVEFFAVLFGVGVGSDDFGVREDGAVGAGAVDFDEVLIDDASGTDVEVTDFRVSHLTVGESDVFAAGEELRVGIFGFKLVHERSGSLKDDIAVGMIADSPAVKYHEKCFHFSNTVFCVERYI